MKKINNFFSVFFFLIAINLYAQPAPPEGKRWQKIEAMSDEFNGNAINSTKWGLNNPTWIGRAPGIFKKNTVSVANGKLKILNYLLPTPEVVNGKTFTHAGGHVGSKQPGLYGYYETRMKANKTFMSSTFWLINNRNEGEGCSRRTTELDITETVGENSGNKDWIDATISKMNSNTHSRNVECNTTPVAMVGDGTSLGGKSWEAYHTYGVWWKSAKELLFYLDGTFVYSITPPSNFNLPMYLRLVTETYNWNPVPNGGGMSGSAESRTTYYDWVHSYKLVDANERVTFNNPPSSLTSKNNYSFNINYVASAQREIVLELWSSTQWITNKTITVTAGNRNRNITINLDSALPVGNDYRLKIHIRPVGTTWREALFRQEISNISVIQPLIDDGIYFMGSSQNNQRLLSRSLENNSARMHSPGNWNDQKWEFTHLGNNNYTIKNVGSGQFLEVANATCENGANVTSTTTNPVEDHKRWNVVTNANDTFSLLPLNCLSKALDRDGGNLDGNVQVWNYNAGNTNQRWKIEPDGTSFSSRNTVELKANASLKTLEIKGTNKGDTVRIYDLMGNIVARVSSDSKNMTLSTSQLSSGIYIVSVNDTYSHKIIVK